MRNTGLALAALLALSACNGKSAQEQGQEVGASIDNAMSSVDTAIDETGNKIDNAADQADAQADALGNKVDETIGKAGNAVDAAKAELKK